MNTKKVPSEMHTHLHANHPTPSRRALSDFVPLALTWGAVVLVTLITLAYLGTFAASEAMRLFMGYSFLIFGGFKAARLRGFADVYSTYDIVAMRSRAYALAYPFIELGLAVLFLAGIYMSAANIATLIVMSVGALGVYLKLQEKKNIPCACLGVVFKIPMTYITLGEDLLMAAMAAAMIMM